MIMEWERIVFDFLAAMNSEAEATWIAYGVATAAVVDTWMPILCCYFDDRINKYAFVLLF